MLANNVLCIQINSHSWAMEHNHFWLGDWICMSDILYCHGQLVSHEKELIPSTDYHITFAYNFDDIQFQQQHLKAGKNHERCWQCNATFFPPWLLSRRLEKRKTGRQLPEAWRCAWKLAARTLHTEDDPWSQSYPPLTSSTLVREWGLSQYNLVSCLPCVAWAMHKRCNCHPTGYQQQAALILTWVLISNSDTNRKKPYIGGKQGAPWLSAHDGRSCTIDQKFLKFNTGLGSGLFMIATKKTQHFAVKRFLMCSEF